MKDLIAWLEGNPDLVIDKLKTNLNTFDNLEAEIVIEHKILCPSTALELAEIFEEYLNTMAVLLLHSEKIKIPSSKLDKMNFLFMEGLSKLTDLANAEAKNNGNLALFIGVITEEKPFNIGMVNFSEDMININFKSHEEGVVANE